MSDRTSVINLNKQRKQRRKSKKTQDAIENRVKYGRPKSAKSEDARQSQRSAQFLEQQRLTRENGDDDTS